MWGKQALSRSSRSLRKWTSDGTNGMYQCRLRSVCGSSSVRCAAAVLGNVSFASIVANLLILVMAKEIKLQAKMPGISQRNQCTSECDYSGTDERRPVLVVHWRYHLIQLVWGRIPTRGGHPAVLRYYCSHPFSCPATVSLVIVRNATIAKARRAPLAKLAFGAPATAEIIRIKRMSRGSSGLPFSFQLGARVSPVAF